ncbi:DNA polymerase III subunit epsilon [Bacteroidia bacterium]|nr:DNA polymerase III subunit epsilon [Bacteroidia bacterium]
MQLQLKKPLLVFDLETTGTDIARDRIVEIAMVKIMPNGTEQVKTQRLNPTIPIPAEATQVHHISDADVKNCPTFKQEAKNIYAFMEGCDLAGYNSLHFDVPLLVEEFLRVGMDVDLRSCQHIDVQNIFHKMEQRTLVAAYKFYCHNDLVDAHSAVADTQATYEVLKAQLDKYKDLQNDVKYLSEFSTKTKNVDYAGRIVIDDKGNEVFNFGKHKGKRVTDVLTAEPSYFDWMLKSEFALDTKRVLTQIKLRGFGK